jgi:hypothetical protein
MRFSFLQSSQFDPNSKCNLDYFGQFVTPVIQITL